MAFMSYVADSLMLSPQGKYITRRWAETINPSAPVSVDAVVQDLVAGGGLVIE